MENKLLLCLKPACVCFITPSVNKVGLHGQQDGLASLKGAILDGYFCCVGCSAGVLGTIK